MSFAPNWVSAPGNTIVDILEERRISIEKFCQIIDEKKNTIDDLISGNYRINQPLASKLKSSLGFSEEFWIQRDKIYFERNAELESEWIRGLPVSEMKKRGLINNTNKLLDSCFNFFGISSLSEWNSKYQTQINSLAFRKSSTFETDLFSIAVWVRQAEILTKNYKIAKWNKNLFESKLISEIKPLIKIKSPRDFLPKLIKICAECGVKLAIVPSLGKNRASGAVKFLGEHALMILSFRHLTDDHFWFTFFHEAGHLILHSTSKLRVDSDHLAYDEEEHEANLFAEACLIPYDIQDELSSLGSNKRRIISFSMKAGISPGIVVGQMQFKEIISFNYLNSYKRRYIWDDIQAGIDNITFN